MKPVDEGRLIAIVESGPHQATLTALIQALRRQFVTIARRLNGVLPKDGTEPMTAPLMLGPYTTATRPAAASWPGGIIYVSDASAGSKFQGSDGSSWVSLG